MITTLFVVFILYPALYAFASNLLLLYARQTLIYLPAFNVPRLFSAMTNCTAVQKKLLCR